MRTHSRHEAIQQVLWRSDIAKSDSDFTYFFSLLLASEALLKTVVLGMLAGIVDDKDRNRYRLEHNLARASGIGDWEKVLEDVVSGVSSHFLIPEAYEEQKELTQLCKEGTWQYDANFAMSQALKALDILSDDLPSKVDMKRWARMFTLLRNKTRAHGATTPQKAAEAAPYIRESLDLIAANFRLFSRPWAHLHRNISGKYRVSNITRNISDTPSFSSKMDVQLQNGVYILFNTPKLVRLMITDPELQDFFYANGGFNGKKFELISYYSGDKRDGDGGQYQTPPGMLPASETEGHGELILRKNCFSNAPGLTPDYIDRPELEEQLLDLLLDDRRPIVTLVGRGGIGKTSLALKVIQNVYETFRYDAVIWLSARDVDLQLSGPKPVRPNVLSPSDIGNLYAKLVLSHDSTQEKSFNAKNYFESQLGKNDLGKCLYIFDNFETTRNPTEMYSWVDCFVRLPNKVLITTRLREFKGDYPVEVGGMKEAETKKLIDQIAGTLGISQILDDEYCSNLIDQSEGHPYVVKILLGEIAKSQGKRNIPQVLAKTEDILTALFERTYLALSPCAQRAFLTLSAWNSAVPRVALEAVLFRSTTQISEVEAGIESLLQYSLAEISVKGIDGQEFIGLPLVASVFGRKKLNISVHKSAINSDVEILQMLGPTRLNDIHLGLAKRVENFLKNISTRIEDGESYESYAHVLEAICRAYNKGWLMLARWSMEKETSDGYDFAMKKLRIFLENENSDSSDIPEAWHLLSNACMKTDNHLEGIHACVESVNARDLPFFELSNTANKVNSFLRDFGSDIAKEEKYRLAGKLLSFLDVRISESEADDLSRMAWLAINSGQESKAREYVEKGLSIDSENIYLLKLSEKLEVKL